MLYQTIFINGIEHFRLSEDSAWWPCPSQRDPEEGMREMKMRHGLKEVVKILCNADRAGIDFNETFGQRYIVNFHNLEPRLTIIAVLGEERLPVWDYLTVGINERQGLQVDGPWAEEIDDILDSLETQIHNARATKWSESMLKQKEEERAHAEKVKRFRDAFAKNRSKT